MNYISSPLQQLVTLIFLTFVLLGGEFYDALDARKVDLCHMMSGYLHSIDELFSSVSYRANLGKQSPFFFPYPTFHPTLQPMWYYTLNGQQAGPISQVDLAQMLNGTLPSDTMVWKDGMGDWLPAQDVDDFRNIEATPAPTAAAANGGTVNPYTAPSSEVYQSPVTDAPNEIPADPIPLDIGFCISQAWKFTTRNFGNIFLFGLVYFAILLVIGMIVGGVGSAIDGPQSSAIIDYENVTPTDAFIQSMEQSDQTGPVQSILEIPSQIIQIFLGMGAVAFALSLIRGQDTSISQLFSQSGGKLFKVIIASILYYLMVIIGFICFIFPGIYLALKFMYFQTAIVDKDLGIIESLKYSSELTRNNKFSIFGLGLLSMLIVIAGFIALGIGLLWALPTVWLASAISYCYLHSGERSIAVQS